MYLDTKDRTSGGKDHLMNTADGFLTASKIIGLAMSNFVIRPAGGTDKASFVAELGARFALKPASVVGESKLLRLFGGCDILEACGRGAREMLVPTL